MWITLLFLCVSVILPNNAQELSSFEAQTESETSYTNSAVSGASARPPVTLRIRSGRNENKERPTTQNSDFPEYYSRDWENLRLVPTQLNSNRDADTHANGSDRSTVPVVPILFRRPDSEASNTSLSQLIRGNEFSSMPVPIIFFQSNLNTTSDSDALTSNGDQVYEENPPNESIFTNPESVRTFGLYRHAQSFMPSRVAFYNPYLSSLNSNAENFKSNEEEKQFSLSGDQGYAGTVPNERIPTNTGNLENFNFYRNFQNFSPARVPFYNPSQYRLNSNDEIFESSVDSKQISSSAIDKSATSDSIASRTTEEITKPLSIEDRRTEQIIPTPTNFYGGQRFFPQMDPAFFPPYPFLPHQRGGTFQATVPYLPNAETFDREAGTGFGQRIPELPEKQTLPENTPEPINENVPSETTVNNFPPPLPYPTGEYPFGLYPSPFVAPVIPNIPQSGIPLNPLPFLQARNVPNENAIANASPPPLVPIKPLPDIVPPAPPQIDEITPEAESGVIVPPEVVPVEEPIPTKTPYAFGFDMTDGAGNDQHRKEVSDISGVVTGSYGYRDGKGLYRLVIYEAGKNGFRAFVRSNEPGVASSGSADVVVVAEKSPPHAIVEVVNEPEFSPVLEPKSDLIVAGSIAEPQ